MKRREFITLLGGAAVSWPLVARAQQPEKLPTIGFLGGQTPSTAGPWLAAFKQRLHELGWNEGRTVLIEYRWAEGRSERAAEIAAEFARLKLMLLSRRDLRPSPRNRRPRSSQSSSQRWQTRLALALSPAWRGRAATSLACRSRRPTLRASAWNSCARPCPAYANWRSWPMPTIRRACGNWKRSRPRPARSASRPSR